jgi:hypothetical protein
MVPSGNTDAYFVRGEDGDFANEMVVGSCAEIVNKTDTTRRDMNVTSKCHPSTMAEEGRTHGERRPETGAVHDFRVARVGEVEVVVSVVRPDPCAVDDPDRERVLTDGREAVEPCLLDFGSTRFRGKEETQA